MILKAQLELTVYLTEPIEFAFYNLIPFLVILDLIIIIWLIYWYYEYINKNPNENVNRYLQTSFILAIMAIFLATSGYIIMFANNKSVPAEIGFAFNMFSAYLLLFVIIFFVLFLIKRKKIVENESD